MKIPCFLPFWGMEILPRGNFNCCCWSKIESLGTIGDDILDCWNGEKIKYLRKKVYENDLKGLCDEKRCQILLKKMRFSLKDLAEKKLDPKIIDDIKHKRVHLSSGPTRINICDSGACNLKCKMCPRYYDEEDLDFSKKLFEEIIPKSLNSVSIIRLSGNGDPFFRKETREFLQNFNPKKHPNIKFQILTHGNLLTPKMWQTIAHNKILEIGVSIDAACRKTYEKIRIGGNWDKLTQNLKFLGDLRKKGHFDHFYFNFAVMRSNYKEMIKFVKLGEKFDCDEIHFMSIYGKWNFEENINDFKDVEIIKEVAQILNDPIFKKSKLFIDTSQIRYYQQFKPKLFEQERQNLKRISYRVYYKLKPFLKNPLTRYLKSKISSIRESYLFKQ